MIRAAEARANVNNYENEQYNKVKVVVYQILEGISKGVEFHSKTGLTEAEFVPFDRSQFNGYRELQLAQEIFESVLVNHGYKIIRNDWINNILKFSW
jgi:hypothetical protein